MLWEIRTEGLGPGRAALFLLPQFPCSSPGLSCTRAPPWLTSPNKARQGPKVLATPSPLNWRSVFPKPSCCSSEFRRDVEKLSRPPEIKEDLQGPRSSPGSSHRCLHHQHPQMEPLGASPCPLSGSSCISRGKASASSPLSPPEFSKAFGQSR